MGFFSEAILAQAAGQHVTAALFVHLDFATQPRRLWEGDGPIDRDGQLWEGMGQRVDGSGNPLQSIEGLDQALDGTAPQLTLTLSGVDSRIVAAAAADQEAGEIEGRDLFVWLGFFQADAPGLEPLGELAQIGWWIMQRPEFRAVGPTQRVIALAAETVWTARNRAPSGLLTDRDQQRRHPGDRGLEQVPALQDRVVVWPRFAILLAMILPMAGVL